ncbi:adenosylmethionine---8-amino-7-oxononanoate aminotransferase [Candidatus Xenohaliotis californiensis]|uniref:adenosylmethionine--8-amino-7-oxononanoate transaminase n=2 Tax=Candidatus Xenohaliotis californiensis TaxID=84677 RepID=A0ABM9N8X5_9RICK|nr:adenosylmethionine---8-amino-7-oxononanoate aminotransferase [Candidatus Xenohaliotis californiensis]
MTSNWWANIIGYSQPKIADAIAKQAYKCAHVRFADLTHEPAIQLTKEMLDILPSTIDKIFFSESGSSAVEVAVKIALQYWLNKNVKNKNKIIAFQGGFHGETFGSMALGKSTGFFDHFTENLFQVDFMPYPETWIDDKLAIDKEMKAINSIKEFIKKDNIAAVIIEPIIQGSSGMRVVNPIFIKKITKLFQENNILVIYDEIMTGFGRLGEFFSSDIVKTEPDIICLGKSLSGGVLPISATAVTKNVHNVFNGMSFKTALAHGHTYSANPICCAASLASLYLLKHDNVLEKIKNIEKTHHKNINKLLSIKGVLKPRIIGSIMAITLDESYDKKMHNIKSELTKLGILIRPLENNIYFMPNAIVECNVIEHAYDMLACVLKNAV